MLNITSQNFEQEVLKSDKTVVVDFWATWCGPCLMLAPIIEQVEKDHPEIKVCKINVDEQPDLAAAYGIMSIPTLYVIKNGEITAKSVGLTTKAKIENML